MARRTRVRQVAFELAAHTPKQFPKPTLPEIAFAGRSNVGKSSLLNALAGRKTLAKVSQAPGKTRSINFFVVDDAVRWVDLPGYGYASRSKKERDAWHRLIESYIADREPLELVVCLSDSRRPPTESDVQLVEWLTEIRVPWIGALTKADKLSQSEKARAEHLAREAYACDPHRPLILCSAKTGAGLDALWPFIFPRD